MVTFKSNNFCFTLNKSAIAYILSGSCCIKPFEKIQVEQARISYFSKLRDLRDSENNDGIIAETNNYNQAKLDCTILSIFTTGGCIDISINNLLKIIYKLAKDDSDFYTYIAVSDFVDYIDFKLNTLDMGCIDFEDKKILNEFQDFCTDKVSSRKRFITKSVTLLKGKSIKLSDYLIYYFNNDGKYKSNYVKGGNNDKKG